MKLRIDFLFLIAAFGAARAEYRDLCRQDLLPAGLDACLQQTKIVNSMTSSLVAGARLRAHVRLAWNETDVRVDFCCRSFLAQGKPVVQSPLDSRRRPGWLYRSPPELTVVTGGTSGLVDGDLFVVGLFEYGAVEQGYSGAERPYVDWLLTDARADDLDAATTVFPYRLTGFPRHKLVALLLKQRGRIGELDRSKYVNRSAEMCRSEDFGQRCKFDVLRFVADNGLELVGLNVFEVTSSTYSGFASTQRNHSELQFCEQHSELYPHSAVISGKLICPRKHAALCDPEEVYFRSPDRCISEIQHGFAELKYVISDLKAIMHVGIHLKEDFTFTVCCRNVTVKPREFWVNPIGVDRISGAYFRTMPTISFQTKQNHVFADSDYYTLLIGDMHSMNNASPYWFPFLMYMKINIRGDNIKNSGSLVVDYIPLHMEHIYFFAFLKQDRERTDFDITRLTRRPCFVPSTPNRCAFDYNGAMHFFGWNTVAVSKIMPIKDEYTAFVQLQLGLEESEVCAREFKTPIYNGQIVCPENCRLPAVNDQMKLMGCLSAIKSKLLSSPFVTQDTSLSVSMRINIPARHSVSYSACCVEHFESTPQMTLTALTEQKPLPLQLDQTGISYDFTARRGFEYEGYFALGIIDAHESFVSQGADQPFVHMLYVNIQDVTSTFRGDRGDVVIPYISPGGSFSHHVVLYRQRRGRIGNADDYKGTTDCIFSKLKANCFFQLSKMTEEHDLQVLSVLELTPEAGSMYPASRQRTLGRMGWPAGEGMVCSAFLTPTLDCAGQAAAADVCSREKLEEDAGNVRPCLYQAKIMLANRTAHVTVASRLSVYPLLTFQSDPNVVNVCCRNVTLSTESTEISPFNEMAYSAELLRSEPKIVFFPVEDSNFAVGDDQMYAVGAFDVFGDVYGTKAKPAVEWLVVNVRGLVVSTGTTVVPYAGLPYERSYVLLVFAQNVEVDDFELSAYSDQPCYESSEELHHTCQMALGRFMEDYAMHVIGGVNLRPRNDQFSLYHATNFLRLPLPATCLPLYDYYAELNDRQQLVCKSTGAPVPIAMSAAQRRCSRAGPSGPADVLDQSTTTTTTGVVPPIFAAAASGGAGPLLVAVAAFVAGLSALGRRWNL